MTVTQPLNRVTKLSPLVLQTLNFQGERGIPGQQGMPGLPGRSISGPKVIKLKHH